MATTTPTTLAALVNCPYGYRHRTQIADDGSVTDELVPLTLEEALAPEEGDVVTEAHFHAVWGTYLSTVFEAQLAADPTQVVLSDVRVEWGVPDMPAYSPDVVVMRGVTARQNWRTFNRATEQATTDLVIEIASATTAETDHGKKWHWYGQARVGQYIIIDGVTPRSGAVVDLVVYQLGATRLELVAPDARGWYWLPTVGVWLGLEGGERPRCYTAAGEPIPDYLEQAAQITDQAAQLAEQAARIAEQAARIAALEAELRRPRGDG